MPTTAAIIGAGTTLGYEAIGGSGGFVLLGEVVDVKSPHFVVDKYEATHYASPNYVKEWLAGWQDGGEVDVELNYVTGSNVTVIGLIRTNMQWKITLPDTHTWTFNGFISDFVNDFPNKNKADTKFKIKVTGLPTYA